MFGHVEVGIWESGSCLSGGRGGNLGAFCLVVEV